MSTINQESNKEFIGTQRGIREILKTVREGTRMSKIQLRFAMTVAIVLLIALFVTMVVAGERANSTVLVNEEAELLTDAITAERIFSADGKTLAFQEGYTWSGEGPRYILNERMTTSKPYWLTLSPESEIAEYEQVLGEGRFLQVENLGNNSIWVAMATEDEIQKVTKASAEARIVRLDGIKDPSWLQKGTDEDNKAAEAAFDKIRFVQFERLGNTHIRLRRGTDAEIQAIDNQKSYYEQLRTIALIIVLAALGVFIYALKSGKMQLKSASFRKTVKTIALIVGVVFLGLAVFMTMQANQQQDKLNRQNPMIMVIDGETTEDEEVLETTASDQKFSFPDKQGATRTITIPQRVEGLSTHRLIQCAALVLLVAVLAAAVYFFRYERDLGFPIFNTVVLILLMLVTLYPVLNTLATAFNEGTDAIRGGIGILPRKFSMKSVDNILSKQEIFDAAWVSASKTVIITILNLFWTGMLSYALSRREYVLRKFITTVLVLTMYVNAGLIPNYILISQTLNLAHTYWVYIIPTMFSCFNMIVIRTYITGLPDALVESAKIDGAGDMRIYWKIIFPLCMPVMATVALFVAVGSWNSWFDTRLYNAGQKDPKTLQYLLQMKILTAGTNANAANATTDALKASSKVEPVTIRAAITVISTVPILVVYPLLQKYFVTGMALGSVKG